MKVETIHKFVLTTVLLLCIHESCCGPLNYVEGLVTTGRITNDNVPEISPRGAPQPFLPLLAPSPLEPFANNTAPTLSGLCALNFTTAEGLMSITSTDCHASFAPLLANVICCPQLEATLVILLGQYSKETNMLALNGTHAKHCLSDFEQILAGQGASDGLRDLCSVYPSQLTEGSCPLKDVEEFERAVDSSKLLSACEKIDPVKECCEQMCQTAILESLTKVSMKFSNVLSKHGRKKLADHSTVISDCKRIVLRWLASRLDTSQAKEVLRGLFNCNVNKVCPLVFPSTVNVAEDCANDMTNQTACCNAMDSYVSHLQKQTLMTNLQALDCSAKLGRKLQKSNITKDVYSLCHLSLKDFSLQVGNQEAGCLLPSLPSDATLDESAGVSFVCDLNDNIAALWPSASQSVTPSCNRTAKIPALPAATSSSECGLYNGNQIVHLLSGFLVALMMAL